MTNFFRLLIIALLIIIMAAAIDDEATNFNAESAHAQSQ